MSAPGFADADRAKAAARHAREARGRDVPPLSSQNRFKGVPGVHYDKRPRDSGFASPGAAKVAALAPHMMPGERDHFRQAGSDRPADAGLASLRGAQAAIRRIKLRLALADVGTSVAGLLQVLDHGLNADGDERAAVGEGGIGLAPGDIEGGVGGLAVDGVEGKNVREKELLEGVDVVLQFLDALGIGLRHGLFSSSGSQRTNPTPTSGQSLCDAPKYGDAA